MTQDVSLPLEVHRLVKRYDGRAVVDDVSFTVAPGELFALLGPNGAGKTTTVEIVEGYRQADGGQVRVLGTDPWRAGRGLRARMGLMLQGGGGVDPRTTPIEVLRLYARLHDGAADPAELVELVGLAGVARTRFRRLSGGERQRLALALALVGRPELLVLDEPTAGMDPAARASTRAVLRELCDRGATILLTTHDLADVERVADRVAILHRGRVVALATPSAIAASVAPTVRLRFATGVPLDELAGRLRARWLGATLTASAGDGRAATIAGVDPEPALLATVAGWAAEREVAIVEWHAGTDTLEEAYLALTGGSGEEPAA